MHGIRRGPRQLRGATGRRRPSADGRQAPHSLGGTSAVTSHAAAPRLAGRVARPRLSWALLCGGDGRSCPVCRSRGDSFAPQTSHRNRGEKVCRRQGVVLVALMILLAAVFTREEASARLASALLLLVQRGGERQLKTIKQPIGSGCSLARESERVCWELARPSLLLAFRTGIVVGSSSALEPDGSVAQGSRYGPTTSAGVYRGPRDTWARNLSACHPSARRRDAGSLLTTRS